MPVLFLLLSVCLLISTPALAYIGPGAGLSLMGSFFTLAAGIIIALLAIILWPIRRMMKRKKQAAETAETTGTPDQDESLADKSEAANENDT